MSSAHSRGFRVSPRRAHRLLLLVLVASAGGLDAAVIPKADNADALAVALSWTGGLAPGAGDVALFDAGLGQGGPFDLGAGLSWGGIRVGSPAADVTFSSGYLLTLGNAGVDLGAATRNLSIQGAVHLASGQTWTVANGVSVDVGGALTRANGVVLDLIQGSAGGLRLGATTSASLLLASTTPFATYNRNDFAAVNSSGQVVPGAQVATYTPNPVSGTPSMSGTITGVVDVLNSGTHGIRLGNTLTVSNGIRFASAHATATQWLIDAPSGRTLTVGSILVAPEVGTDRVVMSGTGFLRGSNNQAAGGLIIHQHNTSADFEVAVPVANFSSYYTPLTKAGQGTLVLSANCTYTGPTYVQGGTLLVRGDNTAATGATTVSASATLGGTGVMGGSVTIQPDAVLASDSLTFKGLLTLQGDTVVQIDGTATRGTDYDAVTVASGGSLAYGGRLALGVNQVLAPGDYVLRLFDFPSAPSGSFSRIVIGGAYQLELVNTAGVWTGASGGVTFSFSQATGELSVNVPVTQTNGTLILISEHRAADAENDSPALVVAPVAPSRS